MAKGAVEPDLIDAETPAVRDPDWQIFSRLGQETHRCEPARQLLWANGREGPEDPVRRQRSAYQAKKRTAGLAADRTVLEVLGDLIVDNRAVAVHRDENPQRHNRSRHKESDQYLAGDRAPARPRREPLYQGSRSATAHLRSGRDRRPLDGRPWFEGVFHACQCRRELWVMAAQDAQHGVFTDVVQSELLVDLGTVIVGEKAIALEPARGHQQ